MEFQGVRGCHDPPGYSLRSARGGHPCPANSPSLAPFEETCARHLQMAASGSEVLQDRDDARDGLNADQIRPIPPSARLKTDGIQRQSASVRATAFPPGRKDDPVEAIAEVDPAAGLSPHAGV